MPAPRRSMSGPETACVCTGVRWCAACRDPQLRAARGLHDRRNLPKCLQNWSSRTDAAGPAPRFVFDLALQRAPGCPDFAGVVVLPELLSSVRAEALLAELEREPFRPAQSGKQKQHWGARVNFKRRKIRSDGFRGLPTWVAPIVASARRRCASDAELAARLAAFRPTDVFALRYHEQMASNLDLHVDDEFAYGELILDLSLETDSVLTFVRNESDGAPGDESPCVRVPLPARSLAILFGAARHRWQHGILARDIRGRRTSITLRTLGEAAAATSAGRRVLALAGGVS